MKKILSLFLVAVIATAGVLVIAQPAAVEGATVNDAVNVTQVVLAEITITAPADVVMAPAIAGISGGASNGSVTWTVRTNNSLGYNMNIASTPIAPRLNTNPALQYHDGVSLVDTFADYTAVPTLAPTYAWTVLAAESKFGYTVDTPINGGVPAPLDTDIAFQDDGAGACGGAGGFNAAAQCWAGLDVGGATTQILNRTSPTAVAGEDVPVAFKAEVGNARYQIEGSYQATVTVTATTN